MKRNSFLLHHDSLVVFDELDDAQLGKLMRAMATYQLTGELPAMDFVTKVVIAPFIAQFKRDGEKYEKVIARNRNNGTNGGRPPKPTITEENPNNPVGLSETQNNPEEPRKPDSVSGNDSVSGSVPNSGKEREIVVGAKNENGIEGAASAAAIKRVSIEERKERFYKELSSFYGEYKKETLRAFYNYWSETNASGKKLRYEMEKTWELSKRLQRWAANEKVGGKQTIDTATAQEGKITEENATYAVMRPIPFGDPERWTMEEYNRLKNVTEYQFVGYE